MFCFLPFSFFADINECEDRSICSGLCFNKKGSYICISRAILAIIGEQIKPGIYIIVVYRSINEKVFNGTSSFHNYKRKDMSYACVLNIAKISFFLMWFGNAMIYDFI
jgi:hypothetical protein